jgi:hypothetical protein
MPALSGIPSSVPPSLGPSPLPTDPDTDGDGIPDAEDLDVDNDGVPNTNEGRCTPIANNSDAESPIVSGPTPYLADYGGHVRLYDASFVPFWNTTAPDNAIEIWDNSNPYSSPHANAYSGNQFMELNANYVASNYQDLATAPNSVITWSVAHRGREGVDVATVSIGAPGSVSVQQTMSTGNTAWVVYSGTYAVPSGQTITRFQFDAVSTATGQIASGNFIDAFTVTCNDDVDTDGDGIPDYLDLDSDNDGIYDLVEAGHGQIDADHNGQIDGAPAAFGSNGLYDGVETGPDSNVPNYTIKDSDNDGNYDFTDLDSDGDSCTDVMEAGFIDTDGDGTPGLAPVTVDGNGVVTSLMP